MDAQAQGKSKIWKRLDKNSQLMIVETHQRDLARALPKQDGAVSRRLCTCNGGLAGIGTLTPENLQATGHTSDRCSTNGSLGSSSA